jgi:hypothetical protein
MKFLSSNLLILALAVFCQVASAQTTEKPAGKIRSHSEWAQNDSRLRACCFKGMVKGICGHPPIASAHVHENRRRPRHLDGR